MTDRIIVAIGFITIILLIAIVIADGVREVNSWEQFKTENDCKVVGRVAGSVSYAIEPDSVKPIFRPAQTGYACNDGVTYWR